MVQSGAVEAEPGPADLLIRGVLSGALLGIATGLALGAAAQPGQLLVGALILTVGVVMIVLLGPELVTGSFAVSPMAVIEGQARPGQMLSNWSWVLLGNLAGSIGYARLFVIAVTDAWQIAPVRVAERVRQLAKARTIGYAAFGAAGMVAVFVKAMLCNWMVCMGVVMGLCSTSVTGRIAAAWMPILVFFAQVFEHRVVNMFVIPGGMLMGAKVTLADRVIWNLIPVTPGNLAGGFLFVGLALFITLAPKRDRTPALVQSAD